LNFRTAAKIAALVVIVLAAPWGWSDIIVRRCIQLHADGRDSQLVRFVVLTIAMFAGIAIAAFLKDARLRIGLALLFAVGFAADQLALAVTGQHTSIELMQVVWSERALAGDAASTYAATTLSTLAWVLPLFATIALRPSERTALPLSYGLVPLICLIFAPINIRITSLKIDEYPSTYAVSAQLLYAILGPQVYAGPRQDIAYASNPKPLFDKILFVIDESVRADYLQVVNPQFDNTPFLSSVASKFSNFGVAISVMNASVGSRVALRTGLRSDQLPDIGQMCLRQPVIWQFAKRAGMRTVYIDAWRPIGEMHSYMNTHEMKFIDQHIAVRDGPKPQIDARVAEQIKIELAVPGPALIVVEKIGSHFPYSQTVQPDSAYEPAGIDQLPASRDLKHRSVLRDYMLSTRNSVDVFFEHLFPSIAAPGTVAIYTSDHGQSMFEGGYEATHGTMVNAHPGEGRVPIFVFSGDPAFNERMQAAAKAGHDRATHFEIFPTLLLAMGFGHDWVQSNYGNSLLEVPTDRRRRFLAGNLFGGTKSKLVDAE
jgi:glucan phosphoethanolaminetransferase (alkaline phosphatase superfamily)